METAIYESAKSSYGVLITAQIDRGLEYADHLLSLYEIKKKALQADKENSSP